ncbi:MAG: hypothetical protein KQH63_21060 [Desulfobulbaceae bacterium]|nr:hypothetical protein [Desulfobulbaceae bacterium]
MKKATLTKKKQRVRTGEQSLAGLDSFAKGSISVMGGVSALIGIWAASCFIAALFSSGPMELAYGWFKAVTGM